MKTREEIINSMCLTYDHAYLLRVTEEERKNNIFLCGLTEAEQQVVWRQMAQLFDNDIAPFMIFKP